MAGYRNIFISKTSIWTKYIPHHWLQMTSRQNLILPFYHSISDISPVHIRHLYPVKNVKQFEEDLDFLLKYYNPLSYSDFDKHIINDIPFKKPSFLLSFDDGLSQFYDVIAPVLLKKGIPAICFLNDSFIDNKDMFFRYKTSLLIDRYLLNPKIFFKIMSKFKITDFKKFILHVKYHESHVLDEIAHDVGYDFNEFLKRNEPYLTSEQINSLIKDGFYFGAHSKSHPEYQYLNLAQQLEQSVESVNNICSKFNLNYRIFSFPFTDFGVSKRFFELIGSEYDIHYTFGSAGQKHVQDTKNHQRIPMELSHLSAKEILNSELLYYLLKKIIRKKINLSESKD